MGKAYQSMHKKMLPKNLTQVWLDNSADNAALNIFESAVGQRHY
jgi:hypothetical protein